MKHEQLSEQQIPDDLKDLYRRASGGDVGIREYIGKRGNHGWEEAYAENGNDIWSLKSLIERIAKAESKVAELEAKIAQARRDALIDASTLLEERNRLPNYIQSAGYFAKSIRALIAKETL